jgi:hypothetical protein
VKTERRVSVAGATLSAGGSNGVNAALIIEDVIENFPHMMVS